MDAYFAAQRRREFTLAQRALEEALEFEAKAAELAEVSDEPTRSVLLRSAASIALLAGEEQRGVGLIALALRGHPPEEIKQELCELLVQPAGPAEELPAAEAGPSSARLVQEITIRRGSTGRARVPLRLASKVPEMWEAAFVAFAREGFQNRPEFLPISAQAGSYTVRLGIKVGDADIDAALEVMKRLNALALPDSASAHVAEVGLAGVGAFRKLAAILAEHQARIEVRTFHQGEIVEDAFLRIDTPSSERMRQLNQIAQIAAEYVDSTDVPQANDLDKVMRIVDLLHAGAQPTPARLGVGPRQVRYYTHAAEVLGYVEDGALTSVGDRIALLPENERMFNAVVHFEATRVARAWMLWCDAESLLGVDADSATAFLRARALNLSESTLTRRATTLTGWHRRLAPFHYRKVQPESGAATS
ncbi:hypothetical protein [Haliangium sp.]|uniref:hypothetical protein n=1 Tax=Haliangium sp. TaxID=2663208 RepID=UPI003D127701